MIRQDQLSFRTPRIAADDPPLAGAWRYHPHLDSGGVYGHPPALRLLFCVGGTILRRTMTARGFSALATEYRTMFCFYLDAIWRTRAAFFWASRNYSRERAGAGAAFM